MLVHLPCCLSIQTLDPTTLALRGPRCRLIPLQLIRGSISERQNTSYSTASTTSGIGSMTVRTFPSPDNQRRHGSPCLELVQRLIQDLNRNMASIGSSYWRYSLSRSHGHQRYHLSRSSPALYARRHPKHMRPPSTRLLGLDRLRIILDHVRNVNLTFRRAPRSRLHGHHAWLYISLRGRKLRQRGDCHLLVGLHLLPMDQICEERLGHVGCFDRSLLRLHGVCMGRLCLHHQSAAIACLCPHLHGSVQPQTIRQL